MNKSGTFKTHGFEGFRQGTFGNAGHNLYVSRAGVLQRIHQYDFNKDGYVDLIFCNDHNFSEVPPIYVYGDALGRRTCVELPTEGAKAGVVADLNGDGYDDLVLGMWQNGMILDLNAYVYYGGPDGWSERRLQYLPAPACTSVAAGDFNGDGRLDLAFLCRRDWSWQRQGQVRVFYQTELGFEPKRFVDLPQIEGAQLAAEDLDGDGYAELVVHSKSGQTRVFWGGPGGIDPERATAVPVPLDAGHVEDTELWLPADQWIGEPASLAKVIRLGDVPHLFVARANSVSLVPVGANRSFGAPITLACPQAIAAAAGDVNGDGFQDIVVACVEPHGEAERSWVYWGSAQGYSDSRRTALQSSRVYDVAVGDLEGDGYDDVVLCQGHTVETYSVDSYIYRGGPDGVSAQPVRLLTHNPQRVLLGRPAGGALPSVVFVNYRAGNVRGDVDSTIFFGGPDGFSESRRKDLPAWGPIVAATCDFNDDGHTDLLLVSSYVAGLAQMPEGKVDGRFDTRMASLYEGDAENPGSYIYLNGPRGFSDRPEWTVPINRAFSVCCADLNRDGYLDLVFSLIHHPDLVIFYGTAEGFDAAHAEVIHMERDGVVYDDARFICLADLNNDGWLDLVVPQVSHDRSFILWGGAEGFSMKRCQMLSVWHGTCARAADLTGNGYLDLIVSGHQPVRQPPYESIYHTHQPAVEGPHDSFIHIYWNGPAGLREDNRTMLPVFGARSVAVADFNNDGCLDLFATSYHNGRVRDIDSYLYWNRPGRGFSALDRQRIFTHAASQAVAVDFNEDGWIDLAIANHKTFGKHVGDSWVLWNGPDGFVEGRTTNLVTAGVHGIYAVDPGSVVDRGPEEYYVSPAFKLPGGAQVTEIAWQAELPPKSWVKAQLRFAGAQEALESAPWMGPTGPGSWFEDREAVHAGQFAGQWGQYRLALGATNSCATPRVTEVTVAYGGAD